LDMFTPDGASMTACCFSRSRQLPDGWKGRIRHDYLSAKIFHIIHTRNHRGMVSTWHDFDHAPAYHLLLPFYCRPNRRT
jgi:hypothetical protein